MGRYSKSNPQVTSAKATVDAKRDDVPCQPSGLDRSVPQQNDSTPLDRGPLAGHLIDSPLAGLSDEELDKLIRMVLADDD